MEEIARHYDKDDLLASILRAAADAGIEERELTVEQLGPVDEFHIGGRGATEHLLEQAGIPSASHILDIGSGIGGTARYLAHTGRHTVVGIDLTPAYVQTATALTEIVGLDNSVTFRQADVNELPFEDASFDAAVMLHVGMNLPDKRTAFSEVARTLVGGGLFAVYDIMALIDGEFDFPVPWASSQSGSFLATAENYANALTDVGFEILQTADRSDYAMSFFAELRQRTGNPPPLGLHLLMGEQAQLKFGNMIKAVEAGVIGPVEIIAKAP